jgi:hypothetical protein
MKLAGMGYANQISPTTELFRLPCFLSSALLRLIATSCRPSCPPAVPTGAVKRTTMATADLAGSRFRLRIVGPILAGLCAPPNPSYDASEFHRRGVVALVASQLCGVAEGTARTLSWQWRRSSLPRIASSPSGHHRDPPDSQRRTGLRLEFLFATNTSFIGLVRPGFVQVHEF